jgi:hypothetical protein
MNFVGLFFLLVAHFFTGRGVLAMFNIRQKPVATFAVSMLTGLMIAAFVPFFLQLFYVPITAMSVGATLGVVALACCVPLAMKFKTLDLKIFLLPGLYEVPYFIIYLLIMWVVAWKSFFMPPTPRDMLTGPELIAKYAVLEKTMINSIYSVDLTTTNNYLKPAFVASLQIIYKLFVTEVGQIWLAVQFASMIIWMYSLLKEKIHPVIGGLLLLLFIAIPEVFAYSFMLLFDYSSMVFFFAGYYFLARYVETKKLNEFAFSTFMFAVSNYVRSETLVLIGMTLPLLIFNFRKDKLPWSKVAIRSAIFLIAPYVVYFLSIGLFDKYYLPAAYRYNVNQEVNKHLGDVGVFFGRWSDMNSKLIFSDLGERLYAYFFYFFIVILLVDVIAFRKSFTKEGKVMLYGIAVLYVGLPFLGYLLPLMDLANTTKRGLFKMFPLMLIYMRNSGALVKLSTIISNWENSIKEAKPFKAPAAKPKPQPQVVTVKNKGKK